MLSAFTARPIIELKQRDKSKIEAILAHGDRVLVGLNTGSLRIYRLNNVSLQDSPPTNGTQGHAENGTLPQPDGVSSSSARPASTKPTDLLREVDKFSSRAVEQLAIIKEANTLVSLSAYHISLHDLGSYELIETLQRTKNATCFAVTSNIVKDAATGIPEIISRLAVAVKRRLILWRWHAGELSEDVAEIVLPEAIRTITWATATTMVCGMNAGYVLIDVETSTVSEIAGTAAPTGQASRFGAASMGYMGLGGYMPKPLAARLAEGEMLLAKDINTLFIDAEGKPLDKRQIPWQVAPDFIGYSYPYIVALQPPAKGALEVRNPDTLSLLQNISLPGAAQMHFPPPTVSLVHAAKGFLVSSERCVWKMDADDYDAQVSELIQQAKYDEAISVLNMLEAALLKDKAGTLREVKMRKAETLFRAKRYRDSMDLFNEDEVHAPPERVLRLFPPIIAQDLSADFGRDDETASLAENEDQEEYPPGEDGKTNGDKHVEDLAEVASSVRPGAFAKYWPMGGGHKKVEADAASIASSKKGHKDDDAASIKASQATQTTRSSHENRPLEGDDLKDALRALSMYLVGTRTRLGRVIDHSTGKLIRQPSTTTQPSTTSSEDPFTSLLSDTPKTKSDEELEKALRETLCLVDTTLFRAYIHSTPTLTGSLFRLPNFCDPEVVNEKLLQSHRYSELVEFFRGKKLHREALTLLRRFGTASETEPNGAAQGSPAPDNAHFDEKRASSQEHDGHEDPVATKLDDPMAIPINPNEIPDQLRTPQRTVVYLQYLPPSLIDLILEFSEWVLRRDPDLGMEVFVADTENAETLSRARVAQFLGDIDENLEIRYLEHVISELNDATPDFHNRLVELFVQVLDDEKDSEAHDNDSTDSAGDKKKPSLMERLVKFLRESRQYSLSRAYAIIPRDEPRFYEAQAVVLSNMGSHKQALDIYVFKMQDYTKAEDYCNRIHKLQSETSRSTSPSSRKASSRPSSAHRGNVVFDQDQEDPESTPSIYHTLLSLYLTPSPPHQPNLEPALRLLSKHGSRLPAVSTLSLIPDDLPVNQLESYFTGRVRAANSRLAESRVVEGLRRALLVDTQAELLLGNGDGPGGRNRRVVIGEERVCGVCHKRLGNSVVAVLPDNGVVHYGCMGRSGGGASRAKGQVAGGWARSS